VSIYPFTFNSGPFIKLAVLLGSQLAISAYLCWKAEVMG
jgi:hypothetical protein